MSGQIYPNFITSTENKIQEAQLLEEKASLKQQLAVSTNFSIFLIIIIVGFLSTAELLNANNSCIRGWTHVFPKGVFKINAANTVR